MMETREPEIKLFGKNISLPERGLVVLSEAVVGGDGDADGGDSSCSAGNGMDKDERENDMDGSVGDPCETSPGEKEQISSAENCQNRSDSSESDEDSKPTQLNEDSKDGEDKGDATNSQQKTLKKPDKILPCPRCNSMDTKFCYYNNYNVNQPRHFCKSCQRYWTAGGTMRNVPVGAGRRKNKNSSSQCRNMIISEALHPNIKPNGTVLSFGGPDSPLCESMSSVLNLSEKKAPKEPVMPSIPCLPPVPWPYSWNPAICPPGYPMPFYPPPPYFNCIPWMPSMPPNSPTLGKRSSDGELLKAGTLEGNRSLEKKRCEGSVLVPKTLRIDDPDEAAKSSIWTTLGINYDSINKRGMFNAFQTKADKHATTPSPLLQANPAALSRSASFQEKA